MRVLTSTLLPYTGLVVFFILAFFFYVAAYAVLGAAVEDEHHPGQLAWPLILFLMIPMVLISTRVMQVQVLVASPAWWELGLYIGLLVAAIYATAVEQSEVSLPPPDSRNS